MIGHFIRHPVAPNLLMVLMVLAGVIALSGLNRQLLPRVELPQVRVSVGWSSAGAEDVANRITLPVHEELKSLDGIDEITSTTRDGESSIKLKFREGTDLDGAVDVIKNRLDAMRILPASADKPVIAKSVSNEKIASLLLVGPEDRADLRPLGRMIERRLVESGFDRVEVLGNLDEEMAVQVAGGTMRSLGLSLDALVDRIGRYSVDVPAGTVGRAEFATRLRALEQRRREVEFERMPVFSDEQGRRLELGDIADVKRRPRPDQIEVFFNGRPAVLYRVEGLLGSDALAAGERLHEWLEEVRPTLPAGAELHIFDEFWLHISDRLALLIKNGAGGFILVLAVLFLFLHPRIAFWVAIGIPVSFLAALTALYAVGGSINMISLFAFIMTMGIVVDDAIVVAEHGFSRYQQGAGRLEAAEGGARRMFAPVVSSSLTTIAAFIPLLLVGGFIGHLMLQIPIVVICVIAASLIECFLILPRHLRTHFPPRDVAVRSPSVIERGGARLRDAVIRPVLRGAVAAPTTAVSIGVALLIVASGLIAGGHLKFHLLPKIETNAISATTRFAAGTPREQMVAYALDMEQALLEAERELGENLVRLSFVKVGEDATVHAELLDSDERRIRNAQIIEAWKSRLPGEPGIESLVISEVGGASTGADVNTKIMGRDTTTLKAAAVEVKEGLATLPGTISIDDNMPYGHRQLIFALTPEGHSLGFTTAEVGKQLRAAYDGRVAQMFQDGQDEVEVRVMLTDNERDRLASLRALGLVAPSGQIVPLDSVVKLESRRGFDVLRHSNGRLAINITANIDSHVTTARDVSGALRREILPEVGRHHDIEYAFQGRERSEHRTLVQLQVGFAGAIGLMFIVLAWVFRSYTLPIVVLTAIPFACVGVLVGHFAMDVHASLVSALGFFALSGIVVNTSIILTLSYQELRETGMPGGKAIEEAVIGRLRPVVLTTATTIGGLAPLMFERSVQAQLVTPIAVSITFGLAFATLIVVFLVPALLSYHDRFATWRGRLEPRGDASPA